MRSALALSLSALVACGSPRPPRQPETTATCSLPELVRSLATSGTHVALTSEALGLAWELDPSTCDILQRWPDLVAPRFIAPLAETGFVSSNAGEPSLSALPFSGTGASRSIVGTPVGLSTGQLIGDSTPEVLITTEADGGTVSLVRSDSNGLALVSTFGVAGAQAVAVVDLEPDGIPEVLVARPNAGIVEILHVDAAGTFQLAGQLTQCATPFALTPIDTGGAILVCRAGGVVVVHGSFDAPTVEHLERPDGVLYDAVWTDLDDDGHADVAAVDPFAHVLVVWWGGSSGFGAPVEFPVPRGPVALRSMSRSHGAQLFVLSFENRKFSAMNFGGGNP